MIASGTAPSDVVCFARRDQRGGGIEDHNVAAGRFFSAEDRADDCSILRGVAASNIL